jgi:hypothetical protein
MGVELRDLCLLSRYSLASATPPALFVLFFYFFVVVVVGPGFELRASHLKSRVSTT